MGFATSEGGTMGNREEELTSSVQTGDKYAGLRLENQIILFF